MPIWLGFERRVAVRFLREGRMQTVLIIVGVAAGVAVIAYISALISGLQQNLLDKTLGAQAHISVSALDDVVTPSRAPTPNTTVLTETQPRVQRVRSIANWAALVPLLEQIPGIVAVSPSVVGAGLALRGEALRAVSLTGVDLDRYDQIVNLRAKVVDGAARLSPGEGIIGSMLAADLGVHVGDRINLVSGNFTDQFRVTATVDFGVRELNRRAVVLPLRAAQSLMNLPGGATSIDITLADPWAASAIAADLASRWPYKVESWQETNTQLVSALNAQSVSTGIIRGVVMAVVILGIASVLVVSVVQKRREIGILRAMGATRGQVLRIFLLQGAIVGGLGSILGVALAVVLIYVFTAFVRDSNNLPLFVITLAPKLALQVALIATVSGVLAAIAPARRAAALDPAEAIRI
jgi:lipoprotein-releasing system permease protein